MTTETGKARRSAPLKTPNPLSDKKVRELSGALNLLLADAFALYLKTKNFHWHVSGPHFRELRLRVGWITLGQRQWFSGVAL